MAKLAFLRVFEYDVRRDPVRGLAWPKNEIKSQVSIRSLVFRPSVSATRVQRRRECVSDVPEFANITALVPQTGRRLQPKGISAGISDLHAFAQEHCSGCIAVYAV